MRDRKEIEESIGKIGMAGEKDPYWMQSVTLEVLLDIRELLRKPPVETISAPEITCSFACGVEEHDQCEVTLKSGVICDCECHASAQREQDPLFDEAAAIVAKMPKDHTISTPSLRKALQCHHAKADALMNQLEAAGIISAPDEKGRRKVL